MSDPDPPPGDDAVPAAEPKKKPGRTPPVKFPPAPAAPSAGPPEVGSGISAGGAGTALILLISQLPLNEPTKLALTALVPFVAVGAAGVFRGIARWAGDVQRRAEFKRVLDEMEADIRKGIEDRTTGADHRAMLVKELEALQVFRIQAQKDTRGTLTPTAPTVKK